MSGLSPRHVRHVVGSKQKRALTNGVRLPRRRLWRQLALAEKEKRAKTRIDASRYTAFGSTDAYAAGMFQAELRWTVDVSVEPRVGCVRANEEFGD